LKALDSSFRWNDGGVLSGVSTTVIPAKAGIQCLSKALKALDSSFRWNDGS
jgi:hypothetical protein